VLDLLQRGVIWHTKQNRDPKSDRWRTSLPVFFIGGGKMSEAHLAVPIVWMSGYAAMCRTAYRPAVHCSRRKEDTSNNPDFPLFGSGVERIAALRPLMALISAVSGDDFWSGGACICPERGDFAHAGAVRLSSQTRRWRL